MLQRSCLLVLAILSLHACSEECAVEACEDFERAQSKGSIETGIVGVVAFRTDACENDCCECEYTQTTLMIFPTDTPIVDSADAQLQINMATMVRMLDVDTRYEQALDRGRYAACDQQLETCANLELAAGEVFTLNLKTLHGPMQMRVFDDFGARQRDLVVGAGAPY